MLRAIRGKFENVTEYERNLSPIFIANCCEASVASVAAVHNCCEASVASVAAVHNLNIKER